MKIAAFDFDGTILFEDGIADDTLTAIREWRDAGNLAVAATGKSLSATQYSLRGYDLSFDYAAVFTGAVLTDGDWEVLHRSTLDPVTVRRIVEDLSPVENISVYGTMLGGRDVRFSTTIPSEKATSILTDFLDMDVADIDTLTDASFVGVPVRVPDNAPLRDRIHRDIMASYEVGCMVNQNFVDILPAGASKGAGLERLLGHLGVARDEVELISFGDSWNDLSMHAIADQAFSFPWSPDDVKNATGEVIGSVAEVLPRL
ncbi:MAG TPA: Cof-type HAD-IIB family hydrolase [Candidatus Corynebacterium avicola]|uniref:Cof-type HAD-IIB family hydrolase n=1 Tax=Candidatus Corynebacterium avicola TaxID=2838527 RepID=A0A9D1RSX2_9CORY|nr:Cof-type HAD-IIB family hydrolase [Candidatus Corynebacterium avicola]